METKKKEAKRIGVFICHCGLNIAGVVDVKKVAEEIKKNKAVYFSTDYVYMCSEPGQKLVSDIVKREKLDGVVIANCSPTLHEKTFQDAGSRGGLNKYRVEIANIREQNSWPHEKHKETATYKALKIVEMTIEKLKRNSMLEPLKVPITKKVLVIGGGITGIQASLDIADAGYEVYLVEREQTIGGNMAKLSETFPTLDCPQCIMTPKMTAVSQNPNIHLMTYSELEEVSGYVGNFKAKIKRKARYVNWDICTGCGECIEACPTKVKSEFDAAQALRKAIYVSFAQAVPNTPVIDKNTCLYLKKGVCKICEKTCSIKAIKWEDQDTYEDVEIGSIVVATGFELLNLIELPEYGGGKIKDVVDGLQFERYLAASGPTAGVVKRPSDGKIPESIVFIQCAGSRDPENHLPYCSRVCCMYTAKQAMIFKHSNGAHHAQAYIFYIDIRTNGKGYEEFYQRTTKEDKVMYIRGKPSKLYEEDGKIIVLGSDTLTGEQVEIKADMVVLATGMVPSNGIKELASKLRVSTDVFGWLNEAHLKLRPFETLTAGVFIAGVAQYPKDITDSVAQGSGVAAKVLAMFSKEEMYHEPLIAKVDKDICTGCGRCESSCAYQAIKIDLKKKIAVVNEALCEGCGACSVSCTLNAVSVSNFDKGQILNIIEIATKEYEKV